MHQSSISLRLHSVRKCAICCQCLDAVSAAAAAGPAPVSQPVSSIHPNTKSAPSVATNTRIIRLTSHHHRCCSWRPLLCVRLVRCCARWSARQVSAASRHTHPHTLAMVVLSNAHAPMRCTCARLCDCQLGPAAHIACACKFERAAWFCSLSSDRFAQFTTHRSTVVPQFAPVARYIACV